jgi:hypothetical protein
MDMLPAVWLSPEYKRHFATGNRSQRGTQQVSVPFIFKNVSLATHFCRRLLTKHLSMFGVSLDI